MKLTDSGSGDEKFYPRGAIAFFVLLLMLCIAIWYMVYYLMLQKS